ncbi:DUF2244 domain-containing protein [Sulfuricaulis sp.]
MDTRHKPGNDGGAGQRIFIRPNRSLSPWGMALLFAWLATISLTIGTGFLLVGAWLVLPFAGLEMAVVAAALYYLFRHIDDHELIVIGDERVTVIRRRGRRERRDYFQRYWLRVSLVRHRWYPSRLELGSHGRFVVVGTEIGEEERRALSARLNEALRGAA